MQIFYRKGHHEHQAISALLSTTDTINASASTGAAVSGFIISLKFISPLDPATVKLWRSV